MRDRLMRTVSFNFNFRTIAYDNLMKRSYESLRMKIKIFDASLLGKINQISLNPCRIKVRVKLEEKYIHISWKKNRKMQEILSKREQPYQNEFYSVRVVFTTIKKLQRSPYFFSSSFKQSSREKRIKRRRKKFSAFQEKLEVGATWARGRPSW